VLQLLFGLFFAQSVYLYSVKMKDAEDRSVIQTRQLTIGYSQRGNMNVLFENLNLQLRSGELTCFMGRNGIGKSTLIRTFLGVQKPLSGDVGYIEPPALGNRSPIHARQVAVVLTDRITAVNMNVYELVSFGRYPYLGWDAKLTSVDHAIVQRSIDHVQIQHLVTQKIYELSDGQLQMVMIARALAQDTPIILLDEPTAHLDLNNRLEIMNLLRKLAHTMHKAILVATHELDLALQTADVVWLAGNNRSILTGIPEDLVLNGAFDEVFQFKGFDLRTGKLHHEAHHSASIKLVGKSHAYLWTKNALERSGFSIADEGDAHAITIVVEGTQSKWVLDNDLHFDTISALLIHLKKHQPPQGN